MRGMGKKNLEMLCPSFKDHIILHAWFGKEVILMIGKGWPYRDYQTPLTQEYIFSADTTVHVSSTELTEVGLPSWPYGWGQGCWERIFGRKKGT